MKIINSILLVFATALVAVPFASGEETATATAAADAVRDLHGEDPGRGAAGGEGYGKPGYRPPSYKYYFTGSCTCAQDAYNDVLKHANDAIDKIPFDVDTHDFLMEAVDGLAHCALDFLHGLDCGCDHGHTIPPQYWLTDAKLATSTYQCCCDAEAIKEVVIQHIDEISCSWGVFMDGTYMGATAQKLCDFGRYDNIFARVFYAISHIGEQYLKLVNKYAPEEHQFKCEYHCPDQGTQQIA